jgi:hypothetical protein
MLYHRRWVRVASAARHGVGRRSRSGVARLRIALLALVVAAGVAPAAAFAATKQDNRPLPTVTGPVEGGERGFAYTSWPWSLEPFGYRQEEFFIGGTARAFGGESPAAEYKTRFQVTRPVDPKKFNGTVVVEWHNVSGQMDVPIDWNYAHPWAMREGVVWVTVSAQQAGVCGNVSPVPGNEVCTPISLKGWDAERYGSLNHPGDDFSFDIFSQVGEALEARSGVDPLAGLRAKRVIATGQSQAAGRLNSYMCNGADAAAQVYDAVLSDADVGSPVTCTPRPKYLRLWTEDSMQPDASLVPPNGRIWEIAGAAHGDRWHTLMLNATTAHNMTGEKPSASYEQTFEDAGRYGEKGLPAEAGSASCAPDSTSFPRRYAVDAALQALETWVMTGKAPPISPAIEFSDLPTPSALLPTAPARDVDGNAVGGIRLPVMQVPVATYIGATCGLFGTSISFSPVRLQQLYPNHDAYVDAMRTAIEKSVTDGFLLLADGQDLMRRACASPVGGPSTKDCPQITARSFYDATRGTAGAPPAADPPPAAAAEPVNLAGAALPATGGSTVLSILALLLMAAALSAGGLRARRH